MGYADDLKALHTRAGAGIFGPSLILMRSSYKLARYYTSIKCLSVYRQPRLKSACTLGLSTGSLPFLVYLTHLTRLTFYRRIFPAPHLGMVLASFQAIMVSFLVASTMVTVFQWYLTGCSRSARSSTYYVQYTNSQILGSPDIWLLSSRL